jgi:hypothetical protein
MNVKIRQCIQCEVNLHNPLFIFSTLLTTNVRVNTIDILMGINRLLGKVVIEEVFIRITVAFWSKKYTGE